MNLDEQIVQSYNPHQLNLESKDFVVNCFVQDTEKYGQTLHPHISLDFMISRNICSHLATFIEGKKIIKITIMYFIKLFKKNNCLHSMYITERKMCNVLYLKMWKLRMKCANQRAILLFSLTSFHMAWIDV